MLLKNQLLSIGLSTASLASRHRSFQHVSVRDEPVTLTEIDITTVNGLVTRDLPEISYGYYLIGCIDEINDGPVRVLNHQFVDWDKTSAYTCIVGCFSFWIKHWTLWTSLSFRGSGQWRSTLVRQYHECHGSYCRSRKSMQSLMRERSTRVLWGVEGISDVLLT